MAVVTGAQHLMMLLISVVSVQAEFHEHRVEIVLWKERSATRNGELVRFARKFGIASGEFH